jgi:hypothetical protein
MKEDIKKTVIEVNLYYWRSLQSHSPRLRYHRRRASKIRLYLLPLSTLFVFDYVCIHCFPLTFPFSHHPKSTFIIFFLDIRFYLESVNIEGGFEQIHSYAHVQGRVSHSGRAV